MRRQPVRHAVAIGSFGDPRERRQERRHLVGIPSAARRVFGAQRVGLQLVVAPELEKQHAEARLREVAERPHLRHEDAADQHAKRRAHAARVLLRRVARGDVADLVAEHADELRFVVEIRQDAARDVDEPAGQRERIDRRRIDDRKAPRQVRALRASREPHADIAARSAAALRSSYSPISCRTCASSSRPTEISCSSLMNDSSRLPVTGLVAQAVISTAATSASTKSHMCSDSGYMWLSATRLSLGSVLIERTVPPQ